MKMRLLRIGLAQINPIVGDFDHNLGKIFSFVTGAKEKEIDLLCFPELCLTGYPPEDLLLRPAFLRDGLKALYKIIEFTKGKRIVLIVGFVDVNVDIFNAAAIVSDGELKGVYHKMYLPNYGVFDEERYFRAGDAPLLIELNGIKIGITICEDMWYPIGPAVTEVVNGAELIVNISASPYHMGKRELREKMFSIRAFDMLTPVAYVNMVGGQDELVFDGYSFIVDENGEIIARGDGFEECLVIADILFGDVSRHRLRDPRLRKEKFRSMVKQAEAKLICIDGGKGKKKGSFYFKQNGIKNPLSPLEEVYKALVTGVRDYVRKNGFKKVVIGLSGGIDSSLVATIAVDALGAQNVVGVFMPSRFSSTESKEDAEKLATNLGIEFRVIPIEPVFQAYLDVLSPHFVGTEPNVAEENIQARIRGNILMALSNKFGWLVLTTGNKSEMACGYATLYGDMAGGFAVIKDIPKTLVYKLALWRNELEGRDIIPKRVLEKPPSAELRPNQKDTDSLPPYDILDEVLKMYVEENLPIDHIISLGLDPMVVLKVARMVDKSEYKRRQAPPGIRVSKLAFGRDRRVPVTNSYRENDL
ncbi:MAG: hypothetical protein PWQ16_731 [bacterium]|nr:MAG: Glutamine-dependent NAD+ synthetase [bacterium 42_11]MDK2871379.1 hypothetical protein [bacterium]